MTLLVEYLWCEVGNRSAKTLCGVVIDSLFRQAEVREASMAFLVQHHIIRLQVSENNHILVKCLEGQDKLADVHSCFILSQCLLSAE